MLYHVCQQAVGNLVIGICRLQEVLLQEIDAHRRVGMVGDEHLGVLEHLGRGVVDDHPAVFVHQLVQGGALDGELFQV